MIKSMTVEKIKKLVPELGKQTALVRSAQSDLMLRIRALESERAALLKEPITREDFATLSCIDIDRIADRYRERLAHRMRKQMNPGARPGLAVNVQHAVAHPNRTTDSVYGGLRSMTGDFDGSFDELRQDAFTFACRDQLKAAAREAAAAVDPWPFPDAKPMDASIARIEAIDAELESLHEQKGELDELIATIGVEPTPELPMEPTPPELKGREYKKRGEDGRDPFWREGHEHVGGGLVDPRAEADDIRR